MNNQIPQIINDNEYLYRGIIEKFWDFKNNRVSSAAFKDSKGVSVDRSADRAECDCITYLQKKKHFFAITKIQVIEVKKNDAVVKYCPLSDNPYHSEIHNSEDKVSLTKGKASRISRTSKVVQKNTT